MCFDFGAHVGHGTVAAEVPGTQFLPHAYTKRQNKYNTYGPSEVLHKRKHVWTFSSLAELVD